MTANELPKGKVLSLPKNWEVKKLGEVCEFFNDGNWIESKDQSEDGYRLIQTGNIGFGEFRNKSGKERYVSEETFKRLKCTEIFEGDILVSRLPDPVGRSCVIPSMNQKMITAVDCTIIRLKNRTIISDFFKYYSQSDLYFQNVREKITGTTRDRISRNNLGMIPIPIPPLPEQKRIVSIINNAFESISVAKNNAEKNLKNARELFDSYLNGVFQEKVYGYKFCSLDSLCELIVDCEHKTAPTQETGYPSIRTPNIGKGELILENVNRVSRDTYIQWTKRAVPKAGDLILAREAPAGNIAIIPKNLVVCLGQRTVLLRPKKDKLISKYLAYLILSKDVQKILLSYSAGATVQHINMKDIRAFKIYDLSDLAEQKAIVEKLDALSAETKKLEAIYQKKIDDLDELKKSILDKAFKGEL